MEGVREIREIGLKIGYLKTAYYIIYSYVFGNDFRLDEYANSIPTTITKVKFLVLY